MTAPIEPAKAGSAAGGDVRVALRPAPQQGLERAETVLNGAAVLEPKPAPPRRLCGALRTGTRRTCRIIPARGFDHCRWHRGCPGRWGSGKLCGRPIRPGLGTCRAHDPNKRAAPEARLVPLGELLKLAVEYAQLSEECGEQTDAPEFAAWVALTMTPSNGHLAALHTG
jgi:hypothetical protein